MGDSTPARITRDQWGFLCGSIMALGASLSFASARAGILGGLGAVDMIFARYVVAGAIMLPLLLRYGVRDFAGIGFRRSLILMLLGGAPFALLQTGGYGFAPLAHGAVIAPSTVTIVSTIGAALFLRERLSRNHLIGAAVVLMGIGPVGAAFFLWVIGMKQGDPRLLGTLAYATPIASTLLLCLAGYAPLTLPLLAAAGLVTAGGVLAAKA